MAHDYTAIMNGRDIRRFLDIPENLCNRRIIVTIDPVDASPPPVPNKLKTLFANAPNVRIQSNISIEALTEEMNDALS